MLSPVLLMIALLLQINGDHRKGRPKQMHHQHILKKLSHVHLPGDNHLKGIPDWTFHVMSVGDLTRVGRDTVRLQHHGAKRQLQISISHVLASFCIEKLSTSALMTCLT